VADYVVPTTYADITAALAQIVADGAGGNNGRVRIDSGASYTNQVMHLASARTGVQIYNNTGGDVAVTLAATSYIECGAGWSCASADTHKIAFSGGTGGAPLIRAFNKVAGTWADCTFSRPTGGLPVKVDATSASAGIALLRVDTTAQSGDTNPANTANVTVTGSGNSATLTADNCTFTNGAAGVYVTAGAAARTGTVTVRRCAMVDVDKGIYYLGKQSGGLDARFNLIYGAGSLNQEGIDYDPDAGYTPTVTLYRNTIDVVNEAIKATAVHSNTNAAIKGNWGDTVEVPAGSDWDYNGYQSITGAPGANDVATGADPGFTNMAGNSYTLAQGSALIDAGYDTGDGTDYAGDTTPSGLAADIGAYEYQANDCGFDSAEPTDSLTVTATFSASPTGSQKPDQASAETATNWGVAATPADATLCIIKATKAADYVYTLRLNHRPTPGASVELDSTSIATDAGGLCDDPGTASFTAISDAADPTADAPDWPIRYATTMSGEVLDESDF